MFAIRYEHFARQEKALSRPKINAQAFKLWNMSFYLCFYDKITRARHLLNELKNNMGDF